MNFHAITTTDNLTNVREELQMTEGLETPDYDTGKCIRRFVGIYMYCWNFIDQKWLILLIILYRKTCRMPKGL